MNELVLALDLEHSGLETIGIGASVVNSEFKELDRFFIAIYDLAQTKFSDRCWDTFWSKNVKTLNELLYSGANKKKEDREREMIIGFQEFRKKWEIEAKKLGKKLLLVTDNNVFDGGLINELIKKYLPGMEPIPYSASRNLGGNQEYNPFWETFSQQKGLLAVVEPTFKSDWGFTDKIFEIYDIEKPKVEHDHNPANDAYTIAYDQQVLLGIRDGRIRKKVR